MEFVWSNISFPLSSLYFNYTHILMHLNITERTGTKQVYINIYSVPLSLSLNLLFGPHQLCGFYCVNRVNTVPRFTLKYAAQQTSLQLF